VRGEAVGVHRRQAFGNLVERYPAVFLIRHGQAVPRSIDNNVVKGR